MIPFIKMHGLGNDFAVIDNRKGGLPALNWRKLADRHFGIGCDQVVVLGPSKHAHVFMHIYNADGGEVESCGNASRCVAWLISGENTAMSHPNVRIETLAGIIEARVEGSQVAVDMGVPEWGWRDIPLEEECDTLHLNINNGPLSDPVAVSMGNPHMVFFVPDVDGIALDKLGPELEVNPLFPERANVNIAQIVARDQIDLRVWERGTGLTLACGTGACATLVAANLRCLTGRRAHVKLPGGTLLIKWREEDDHILMTGPAEVSFRGEFEESGFAI